MASNQWGSIRSTRDGFVPERPKRGDRNGVVKAGGPGHQPSLSISALANAVAFSMAPSLVRVLGFKRRRETRLSQ